MKFKDNAILAVWYQDLWIRCLAFIGGCCVSGILPFRIIIDRTPSSGYFFLEVQNSMHRDIPARIKNRRENGKSNGMVQVRGDA